MFQVNCGSLPESNCTEVKLGLENVGNLVAAEILFKVPITVGASFVDEPRIGIVFETQPPIGIS